jgi:hypothetical protein
MNQFLRDRILRKLETLSDERLYQVLDYVEFLESKYAERQTPSASIFTRFAETVEDQLRAGRVSASAIAETMNLMNRAMGVLNGVAAAGKSVANDLVGAARQTGRAATGASGGAGAGGAGPPGPVPGAPPSAASAEPGPGATGATNQPPGERRA